MATIQSPCILVCSIDDNTGYCFGCGRTDIEIQMWADYKQRERSHIMATLPARLETIKRKPRRQTRRQILRQNRLGKLAAQGKISSYRDQSI
jgi:predicted Fe-S protein YdhL (DUF1289 family)